MPVVRATSQIDRIDWFEQLAGAEAVKKDLWLVALEYMTGPELNSTKFEETWREWIEYRRQRRNPLTECTIRRQIHKLEELGHDRAVAAIGRSIENGWIGIFPAPSSNATGDAGGGDSSANASRRYDERIEIPRG